MADDGINAKEVGRRIAQARKEADGMSQREVADFLGVAERSVAAYEAGDILPYRFLGKLEELLGRPRSWFLHGDKAMPDFLPNQNDEILKKLRAIERKLDKLLTA